MFYKGNDSKERDREDRNNHYDSLESESSSDSDLDKRASTHYKKVKQHIKQQDVQKSSRKVSRHRRISATDNYNPTIIRDIGSPTTIEEYEVTEKIPMEIVHSNKSKYKITGYEAAKDYWKYSEKYDLLKNWNYSKWNKTNEKSSKINNLRYIILTTNPLI